MPTIRITEKQDAYIFAYVEVSDETLYHLREARDSGDTAAIDAWNTSVQSESNLNWITGSMGEMFDTVSIDVLGADSHIDETLLEV